jgi:hypothetical protein
VETDAYELSCTVTGRDAGPGPVAKLIPAILLVNCNNVTPTAEVSAEGVTELDPEVESP